MSEQQFKILFDQEQNQRLDKFLASKLPDFSRSRLQTLIKNGMVNVDGEVVQKPSKLLEKHNLIQITVPPSKPSDLVAETIPLDIIFENDDVLVINKPAGMVVHPAAGHQTGTLANAALGYAPQIEGIGGEQRPGIVHRLDKNTSGLIIVAKNDRAHRYLQEQFSQRKVNKIYLALVDGHPPTPSGRVEVPIGRHPHQRKKMAVVPESKGRSAISEYHTLERFPDHTLLEVKPTTGRTHQIRLHMAFIGCPITGDTTYGRRQPTLPLKRHFLHARSITITLPGDQKPRTFYAPLPPELKQILENLGSAYIFQQEPRTS